MKNQAFRLEFFSFARLGFYAIRGVMDTQLSRHWLTSHLLQGQRRWSGQGATLEHLRAQGALLTLVLADGGVVHHGQERVFAIPQAGENVLEARKFQKN